MRMLIIFLIVCIAITSYKLREQKKEIIELNSEIINSVALVGQTQSRVSDLLIRVLAVNDNVDLGAREEGVMRFAEVGFPENENEDIPYTHRQIVEDLKEIDQSVDSLWMNNIRQEESCRLILKHLLENKE